MNAFLIDPTARTISQVETDFSLSSIYALLGCRLITSAAGQSNGDLMLVDDEVSDDEHDAFRFGPWEIYSKALMVGTDAFGETVTPKITLQELDAQVCWLGPKLFEANIAVLSFPERALENRIATSIQDSLAWWDDFFEQNDVE